MNEILRAVAAKPLGAVGSRGFSAPGFRTWFMGGFEGATMVLDTGRRLDVLAHTEHDRRAENDYRLMTRQRIETVRDAAR